jgi:hypothetical protein
VSAAFRLREFAPWTGLFAGAAAWFAHHQTASDLIIWDCRLGGPFLTGGLGLICGLVTVIGGLISWRSRTPLVGASHELGMPGFAGVVGAGAAAMFLLAILFQSLTGFIVGVCER